MDNRYFIPRIDRVQYELFRELNDSDFPDTYDEWLKLFTEERQQRLRLGFEVLEVAVDPHNFAAFCRPRGMAPTVDGLHKFADELGRGNV